VAREFCDVFLSWHFVPVDLWAGLGETAVLESVDYRSYGASLSATWRLTDDLTISPYVSLQQINRALNQAASSNVVYADPRVEIEQSMLSAARQGYTAPLSFQSGLSVRYLLSSGDQRWKGASSLR
jgi:hypothetical protein